MAPSIELFLCDLFCLMVADPLFVGVFSCNQSGLDWIGFLIWTIEMIANLTCGQSGDSATNQRKRLFKCLKTHQAFFVQFVFGLSHTENTLNSVFVAHIFYISPRDIIVFLLCCFPALKANLKTTWSQSVELSHSDSPPMPWLIGDGRIKPKCHSPWLCKMTLSSHVLRWITVSPLPQVIYALWSLCCTSVILGMREREGKAK